MASPQIEDGYTKIANELLEALYQFNATGSQFRVMLFFIRKLYGYGLTSRFQATSEIINGTRMNKSQCIRTLKELKAANMIIGRFEETKRGATYRIQKNYNLWKRVGQKVASKRPKGRFEETKTDFTPFIVKEIIKKDTREKNNPESKPKKPKPKKPQNNVLPSFKILKEKYPWLDLKLWSQFREHRHNLFTQTKKHPYNALAEKKAILTLKKFVDEGYKQHEIINPSIISGWAGLFRPKEKPTFELGDF